MTDMSNKIRYIGKLRMEKLTASINLSETRADVNNSYYLRNRGRSVLNVRLTAMRPGIAAMKTRAITASKPMFALVPKDRLKDHETKKLDVRLKPQEKRVLDMVFSAPVFGEKFKSFLYIPNVLANNIDLLHKVQSYNVTFNLPKNAKKLVYSSIKPTSVRKTQAGIICEFKKRNTYPLPISVKWTELDVDISLSKSVKKLPKKIVEVIINVKNNKSVTVPKLVIEDNHTAEQAKHVSTRAPMKFRIVHPNDKDPRLIFSGTLSLRAKESKSLIYRIKALRNIISVPATIAKVSNSIVAISGMSTLLRYPIQPFLPKTSFALPSGWSFDYRYGGDHHLNEHGMWCTSQIYSSTQNSLRWNTGCIYADKNFDDDYRWSVNHQVFRFDPGFAHHGYTPWLKKTGKVSTHNGSFQHPSLKLFSKAVVLLRGWRFDFTHKDHHINHIEVKISQKNFNRSTGRISWKTGVVYADKNWKDNYRYRYYYTILAFNGSWFEKTLSGKDRGGGTHTHIGNVSSNILKNYKHAMVIPTGWKFDYTKKDHHINENHFNIRNVQYTRSTGRLKWTAHLNYCDKNKDDPYNWKYYVLLLATNQGESRYYSRGPYNDNGGFASISNYKSLSSLFKPITWTNSIMDGDETGVDCGGSSPSVCQDCYKSSVNPGSGASRKLFSIKNVDKRNEVKTFATVALAEYALNENKDFDAFYSGPEKSDNYVEAIAWYVHQHMEYVKDSGSWKGAQTAFKTLTKSGHRGSKDFAGDCEDHAILRAALLRSLGFHHKCIFCADHHNSVDQGQRTECGYAKKKGGHTYNIVVYKGKYRIMDYRPMHCRYWANQQCWDQHATDNIWNDHTGKHWDRKDISPYGTQPLVNYPGNPCSPSPNWDWRTYFCDITL